MVNEKYTENPKLKWMVVNGVSLKYVGNTSFSIPESKVIIATVKSMSFCKT